MQRFLIAGLAFTLLFGAAPVQSRAPDTWDGLLRVRGGQSDLVYLLPEADFRTYTKVMIDVPEVAFRKNWQRDQNSSAHRGTGRISDKDVRDAINEASGRFGEALNEAFTRAGYAVVSEPGPDVLRVSTAIIDLSIAAPDIQTAGRSRSYAREAGEATLVVEARDAVSATLLGRSIDRRIVGGNTSFRRDSVTNRADFERLFSSWARMSAEGLNKLKAHSPVDAEGALRR
jgi:Protein of unknown function (DUF3313)